MSKIAVLCSLRSEIILFIVVSDISIDKLKEQYQANGYQVHYIHEIDTLNIHI